MSDKEGVIFNEPLVCSCFTSLQLVMTNTNSLTETYVTEIEKVSGCAWSSKRTNLVLSRVRGFFIALFKMCVILCCGLAVGSGISCECVVNGLK